MYNKSIYCMHTKYKLIISYLIISVFLISFYLCIEMTSYVLFDSGDLNIESIPPHASGSLTDQQGGREGNLYEQSASVLTSSEKIKRWLGWKLIGENKYVTKNEFYQNWDKSFSIKSSLKSEIKDFKKSPLNYLEEYYENSHNLYLKRAELTKEFLRKTHYVEGQGWYTGAQIRQLSRRGYIIRDSQIVRK